MCPFLSPTQTDPFTACFGTWPASGLHAVLECPGRAGAAPGASTTYLRGGVTVSMHLAVLLQRREEAGLLCPVVMEYWLLCRSEAGIWAGTKEGGSFVAVPWQWPLLSSLQAVGGACSFPMFNLLSLSGQTAGEGLSDQKHLSFPLLFCRIISAPGRGLALVPKVLLPPRAQNGSCQGTMGRWFLCYSHRGKCRSGRT